MNSSDLALLKAYIPLKKYTDDIACLLYTSDAADEL